MRILIMRTNYKNTRIAITYYHNISLLQKRPYANIIVVLLTKFITIDLTKSLIFIFSTIMGMCEARACSFTHAEAGRYIFCIVNMHPEYQTRRMTISIEHLL